MFAFSTALSLRLHATNRQVRANVCASASNENKDRDAGTNKGSTVATAKPKPEPQDFTQRARWKEETEAPFRKVRMFVWAGSAASAGVGAFIAGSRVLAGIAGVSGVQPLSETSVNFAVDLGVIGACVALLRLEQKAGQRRLERITRGARMAALRISDAQGGIRSMKDFRWKRRVVIVAGKSAIVLQTLFDAYSRSERFEELKVVIVPVFTDLDSVQERNLELPPEGEYFVSAYDSNKWRQWSELERNAGRRALGDAVDELFITIVRQDGKVGGRACGAPDFDRLLDDIALLPKTDQYGTP